MEASERLRQAGAVIEDGVVRAFDDPLAEVELAQSGAGTLVVPLLTTTALVVGGSDRAPFLHGQLSNVVQGLPVGACRRALQLDARGRVVGETLVAVRDETIELAVDDGRGLAVRGSLEQHVVFDDVAIDDQAGVRVSVTVQGAGAGRLLERVVGPAPAPGSFALAPFDGASVVIAERRRSLAGGYDLHLPVGQLGALLSALRTAGGTLAGERALALARVLAGVASAAHDGGPSALPQEIGLAPAVSFAKGCYLGQEIMARIEARGAVKRGLARVTLHGDALPPERGSDRRLWHDGREAGWLGEWVRAPDGRRLALAVVRRGLPPVTLATIEGAEVRALSDTWDGLEPPPAEGADGPRRDGAVQPAGPSASDL